MNDYQEFILPNIQIKGFTIPQNQHGCYLQIPEHHRHKKIYSVSRNPISRFASLYEFKHWTAYPFVPEAVLSKKYPNFPNLSIEEFYELQIDTMLYSRLNATEDRIHVGLQTVQFIQMFFKNPDRVIKGLNDAYLESDDFIEDIAPITFLRQDHLREDLARVLFDHHGYSAEEVEIIHQTPGINVTAGRKIGIEESLPDSLIKKIAERERLLFRIYKHFDIDYDLTADRMLGV